MAGGHVWNSDSAMNYPTPPSGASNEGSFMRRLVDCLKRSYPIAGNGLTFKETSKGVILSVINPANNLPKGGGSDVYMFSVTQLIGQPYVMAKYWDGNSLGQEIAIAKDYPFRFNLNEVIDEILYTYTPLIRTDDPTSDNNRGATDGLNFQKECVFPRYVTLGMLGIVKPSDANGGGQLVGYQTLILASYVQKGTGISTAGGQKIFWQEVKTGRVWSRRYNQS